MPGEIQKICKTLPFPENDKNWLRGWINSHEKEQQQKKLKYRKWLHMKVFVESFIHSFIHSGVLTRKVQNGHYWEGKISKIIVRLHGDCELCSDPWKLKRTWINWRMRGSNPGERGPPWFKTKWWVKMWYIKGPRTQASPNYEGRTWKSRSSLCNTVTTSHMCWSRLELN